jgi:hypothetical protein
MGMPHDPGRSKHAPTLGLRAVFAGIGRLLLLADRPEATLIGTGAGPGGKAEPQHRSAGGRLARPGRAGLGRTRGAEPESRWRSLDKTGNVRLLSEEDLDDDFDGAQLERDEAAAEEAAAEDLAIERAAAEDLAIERAAAAELAIDQAVAEDLAIEQAAEALAAEAVAPTSLPRAASAAPAVTAEAVTVLPLPNYDELSLASIRARLRGLDVSQLRLLADHERLNAERPEVLGMLERRIEKLRAGG